MSQENSAQPKQGWAPVQYFERCTTIYFERSNIADALAAGLNKFFTPAELAHDARRFTPKGAALSGRAEMPVYVEVAHERDASVKKPTWKLTIKFQKIGSPSSVIPVVPYQRNMHGEWHLNGHLKLELHGHLNAIARVHRWKRAVFLEEGRPTRHPQFALTCESDGTLIVTALFGKMHEREYRKFYNTHSREKK